MRESPAANPRRKVRKSDDSMPTLNQIATRLETGEASRALVDQCLERIKDAAGEGARTFLKVYGEDARMAADAYDTLRRRGATPSLFAGIPISIKDLFDVAGDVTTAGSVALRHAPPATRDATAIARLRAAGFVPIGRHLGQSGLARENGAWRRVIIEKPFGTDLASAHALNQKLLSVLKEHQIFRIDHYLGKETVQNILVLRFANGLFEPIWNRDHIDHVQLTVAESLTVGRRGNYYDATGALRDMVPNHLIQLLSLIAMEPPSRFAADSVRAEKAQLLEAVQLQNRAEALRNSVRAQYDDGFVENQRVEAYRKTKDVDPHSTTETYVALRLMIDNWRWANVPFYLRTGKALRGKQTEVAIKFKQAPIAMFRDTPIDRLAENFLVIGIQPNECIRLEFNAKTPGPSIAIGGVSMTFRYEDYFEAAPSTGYETLIYDCMVGDAILYPRADGIEAGWRVVQPLLDAWRDAPEERLASYRAGSDGPKEADELLARDGRRWRPIA